MMARVLAPYHNLRLNLSQLSDRQYVLLSAGFLFCIGLIMVGSASMGVADANYGNPFYFFTRHLIYLAIGLVAAAVVSQVPMATWNRYSYWLFLAALVLIILVLVPGIGRRVNGSMRWIGIAGLTIQPSELVKFAGVLAMAAYLWRRQDEVRSRWMGFVKPMAFVSLTVGLLLAEPDFGASMVIVMALMVMLFLAGAPLMLYLMISCGLLLVGVLIMIAEPYRMKRLMAFTDPWADQYNSGYQLVQSLIAFGRGDWFGVGLGQSVQKLFYLPEAHTDFVFAVYAEEFGLMGVMILLVAMITLVMTGLRIGQRAECAGQVFSGYVAYGLSVTIGIQAAVNLGVNTGLFPTKGLTLPLVSYGGSSLVMMFVVLAVLLRIDAEASEPNERAVSRQGGTHDYR
ncbi:cell division-specific peptidoglycan biosynthesis regulator FtsW [Paraperlucidibaca baekdonensis]|uniref:Probable peptidoglycan glycosyltransferase FtsW n=1 Tax=Paraperlucidibaca baekdonensis TaxID=748120 RepID=A0A3E0H5H1_9GAMM|nr:putative lipid II flippase FtsW [Paraperlucidibaca baekdonensis]REH38773.1 cell division-specific peptidoglycan biosynthesis regulator FtsW [Paraperlucidibaca baekdonensis]